LGAPGVRTFLLLQHPAEAVVQVQGPHPLAEHAPPSRAPDPKGAGPVPALHRLQGAVPAPNTEALAEDAPPDAALTDGGAPWAAIMTTRCRPGNVALVLRGCGECDRIVFEGAARARVPLVWNLAGYQKLDLIGATNPSRDNGGVPPGLRGDASAISRDQRKPRPRGLGIDTAVTVAPLVPH
jgi:hypothetical protein